MQPKSSLSTSQSATLLMGSMAVFLVLLIICFPNEAFQSSLQGLGIWWNLVFPSLLPFLILTELLIGFGVIQGLGTLFHPFMRLFFRIPGVGGWALASGLIVGFPTGAKITADLIEKQLITREEAERLVSLSHLCSPLFLLGVVGVGFLHQASLGVILAIVHYSSAWITALLMRNNKKEPSLSVDAEHAGKPIAIAGGFIPTMREAYLRDGRAFGKLLGDAVTSSLNTLMLVGGYMMIFSVMINVVNLSGILGTTFLKGLFEIHLGTYAMSQHQSATQVWQLAIMGAMLGWGGLASHAQVRGLTQRTGLRYLPFFIARGLHASIAFVLTIVLWKPLSLLLGDVEPSFLGLGSAETSKASAVFTLQPSWGYFIPALLLFASTLLLMAVLSLLIQAAARRN
jgi:sporulation integral membrane protein YlbJ